MHALTRDDLFAAPTIETVELSNGKTVRIRPLTVAQMDRFRELSQGKDGKPNSANEGKCEAYLVSKGLVDDNDQPLFDFAQDRERLLAAPGKLLEELAHEVLMRSTRSPQTEEADDEDLRKNSVLADPPARSSRSRSLSD